MKTKSEKKVHRDSHLNKPKHESEHNHDHSYHLKRLNRVAGQISGLQKMLEENRYCMDILTQMRAAISALKSLETVILENHLHCCVEETFASKDKSKAKEKVEELIEFFKKES